MMAQREIESRHLFENEPRSHGIRLSPSGPPRDRRGFSLLEVMITVSILSIILVAAFAAWSASVDFFSLETVVADTNILSRRSMETFVDGNVYGARLAIASTIGMDPGATLSDFTSDRVSFSTNKGYEVTPAGPVWYYVELVSDENNDNVDNNGNGLIDEGRLMMQSPDGTFPLPGVIAKDGFRVTWDSVARTLEISITTIGVSNKGFVIRDTARTTIAIRN